MTGRARAVATILTVGLLVIASGCGDDSGDDDDTNDDTSSANAPTTTTTHPSTEDDEEAAFDVIRNLEAEADQLMARLYGDPSVVEDPDNPQLERAQEMLSEDHPGAEGLRDSLEGLNEQGHAQVAASPGLYSETYIYNLESEDADTIRYAYCTVQDMILVDSAGTELDEGYARVEHGIRYANRENGIWKLGLTEESHPEDLEPGSTYLRYCEGIILPEEEIEGEQP